MMENERKDRFKKVAATKENSNWNDLIGREDVLYQRQRDVRSPYDI